MDVLVAGGTGFIGQFLCRELEGRGHDVTALARDPDDEVPEGVDVAVGDVTAYDSIEDAFAGRDAVVNLVALPPMFTPRGGERMHERVHLGGTEHCLQAAEHHDVDRFVQLSALGADPDGETHYIRAKGHAEKSVRVSEPEWVILRPAVVVGDGSGFLSFTRTLTFPLVTPLPGGGKTRFQPVYVEDFASMAADAVEEDDHAGETYEVGGPEVLTLAEIANLLRRASGGSTTVVPVPMPLARLGLTVGGLVPRFPMGPDQYRSLKFDNTTSSNDIDAFGFAEDDLVTLEEYLGVDSDPRG